MSKHKFETLTTRQKVRLLTTNALMALKIARQVGDRWLVGIIVLSVITSAIPAIQALVGRALINDVAHLLETQSQDFSVVRIWLVLGLVVTLMATVLSSASDYIGKIFDDKLRLKLVTDILDHASILDVSFFDTPAFQDTLERVQQNISYHISRFILSSLALFNRILEMVGILLILVAIDRWTLVAFGPIVLPFAYLYWLQSRAVYILEYSRTAKRRWMHYYIRLLMSRDHVAEVKLLNLGQLLSRNYQDTTLEFIHDDRRLYRRRLGISVTFTSFFTVMTYLLFGWIVWRVVQGSLTLGDIALFLGAAVRLRTNLEIINTTAGNMIEDALFVSDYEEFKQAKPIIHEGEGRTLEAVKGDIVLENLSFKYPGTEKVVLKDIQLHIQAGEVVALVGENGAGKSTLAKLIARLYDPTSGRVLLDGQDMREFSSQSIYQQIAFVLQSFNRYEASAHENIAYGDWQRLLEDHAQVQAVAKLAHVDEMIHQMPQGYQTRLGRDFGNYDPSGGQWQKLAIARAFARNASLLILDEPTANIDARAEYELFNQFQELARGRTTILISHRFSTVSMADRIVVLDQGSIREIGTHAELLAKQGHYAELYQLHQQQMQ